MRERNLHYVTNNACFLIMPWVQVANLASHSLSCVIRRVSQDWQDKYAHPIYMLEKFVDRSRYRGTCYQAANWVCTGQTTGRTRNDRYQHIHTSRKDLYVYPLVRSIETDCAMKREEAIAIYQAGQPLLLRNCVS
jgi:hypothetical protein